MDDNQRLKIAAYVEQLVAAAPPLADWQIEQAARILATVEPAYCPVTVRSISTTDT